jgi:hypothetical protein
MHALPIMLVVWGVVVLAFVGVMIYRATLTQHETDQLFLSDETTVSASHAEHDLICQKLNKVRPLCAGLGGAAALMTVLVIGTYIVQSLPDMGH